MRLMVIGIGIAAVLWSGYWLIGSRQATADMRDWFESRAADGWTAVFADLSTRGYPNRFDTTITAPVLALPGGASGWSAPFLQVLRLSYKLEHAIVIFPAEMTVTLAGQQIALSNDRMRASTVFGRSDPAALDRANLEGESIALQVEPFGTVAIARTLAAIRAAEGLPSTYDLAIELRDIAVPGGAFTLVSLDAILTLDAPLTVDGITAGLLGRIDIDLPRFQIKAEGFELSATGDVILDSSGLPSGKLYLQIRNLPDFLRIASDLRLLSQTTRAAIETNLAGSSTDPLELRLDIRRGTVFLGESRLH